ncbi:transglycosylase domain-containing protein [uncultured Desulfobacter sp.]|uniref:transglycosylase domain-containing protein n=1 Tax=uncultured Desulfobacter sp. TaxID=240139 RepID=UPI003748BE58
MVNDEIVTVQTRSRSRKKPIRILFLIAGMCVALAGVFELKTFRIQARLFAHIAQGLSYRVENGPAHTILFPQSGPYDIRLGYTRIPEWIETLQAKGFAIDRQARWSEDLFYYTGMGLFPIYMEKNQTGLKIADWQDKPIFQSSFPQRVYTDFKSIPSLAVTMLLFIENRELLDETTPYRNPSLEYERILKAITDAIINAFIPSHKVAGGSTLATQIEKFRHSPNGITDTTKEKLRQIISASLRSYQSGRNTEKYRKQIVLDYINGIPLSASHGVGEVNGLGDGLWAWYKMDFDEVNRLLNTAEKTGMSPEDVQEAGKAVRAVLSLFISQRRPSYYLLQNHEALQKLTDSHLRLLYSKQMISPLLYKSALQASLQFVKDSNPQNTFDPTQRKTANIIRTRLLGDLASASTYVLDRLDLTVKTTLNKALQEAIAKKLVRMKDPEYIRTGGFMAPHMLDTGDPQKIVYSFSLYEHTSQGNALRVQTNTFDGPFNIDEQMKLDLGSSSKLRALVHYLDIISQLYDTYAGQSKAELDKILKKENIDPLTRWATGYLLGTPHPKLADILDAAMERTYSASPKESFYTGGGVHHFANYKKTDDNKTMTLSNAFRHSVNLVFIRMMRDITNFYIHKRYGITPRSLNNLEVAEKQRLLKVFADKEGTSFIRTFYRKYRGKNPEESKELFMKQIYNTPVRVAAALRYLSPTDTLEKFERELGTYLPQSNLTKPFIQKLYLQYSPDGFALSDIGFLVHVHPLELWMVRYLQNNPEAIFPQIAEHSVNERQEVYRWLFKTRNPNKQNIRIRTIIELEAFNDIKDVWKSYGYPFDYLVPSYASAIGSSGDRPSALCELMGIILNDGMRYPSIRNTSFHFGEGTAYDTLMRRQSAQGVRILKPEVARTVKKALVDVVQQGTAIRIKDQAVQTNGNIVDMGGKTGTGDHRIKKFGPGGVLLESTPVNRAAIFVFFMGDRYFGTITAYVPGADAKDYTFSSSLTVAVLQTLLPELMTLFEQPAA